MCGWDFMREREVEDKEVGGSLVFEGFFLYLKWYRNLIGLLGGRGIVCWVLKRDRYIF